MVRREYAEFLPRFIERMHGSRRGFDAADRVFGETLEVGAEKFDPRWREWAPQTYGSSASGE